MPCISFAIDAIGPLPEIGIAPPASVNPPGSPPPVIRWFRALADTGCSNTSIHSNVAQAAGLKAIGKATIASTTQSVDVETYLGDMFLRIPIGSRAFEFPFRDRQFIQLLHANPNFDALLGMDFFNIGTFHVNGITKNATFCW